MVRELGDTNYYGFGPEVKQMLLNYKWPGNIRELKNTIERTVFHSFPLVEPITNITLNPFGYNDNETKEITNDLPNKTNQIDPTLSNHLGDYNKVLEEIGNSLVKSALERSSYNKVKAAKELNISYNQLRGILRKMKKD